MADDSWKLAAGIAATISQNAKTDHISLENGLDYVQKLNYNKIRQDELWEIWCKRDYKRFEEILGHPIDWSLFAEQPHRVYCKSIRQRAWEACIEEIAAKEGWRYYDVIALNQDPVYQREIGIKNPYPGKTLLDKKSLEEYRLEQQTKNETEVAEGGRSDSARIAWSVNGSANVTTTVSLIHILCHGCNRLLDIHAAQKRNPGEKRS